MHRALNIGVRAALDRMPVATRIVLVVLVVGIGVVEFGLRDAAAGRAVEVPVPSVLEGLVARLRSMPLNAIDDPAAAAVASGVIFGRTDHVEAADEQAFLDSGLWHLLAASGQNIALVAGCCVLLARACGAGRTTGGVLALVAIPAYVLVVGGGASIMRAGVMGELAIVAWLAGGLPHSRHLILVAAAGICWIWPGAHRGLGFQLSFACVLALSMWVAALTASLRRIGVPAWLAGTVAATMLCSAATAPILLLRTGAAPLAGVVANIIAVPIAAGILVTGLAGSIMGALLGGSSAELLLVPAGMLAAQLGSVAHRAAAFPAAQTTSAVLAIGLPLVLALAATPISRMRHGRGRVVLAGAAGTCLAIALVGSLAAGRGLVGRELSDAPAGALRIGVLDVGQGDATLLAIDGHAMLIDVGPPDGRVVTRVRELGIRRIDGIVLTHDSLDHRGGFDAALAALAPRWVGMPRGAPGPWRRIREQAPRLVELCAGDAFSLGPARVDVLHPRCDGTIRPRTGDLHNDGAMVLLVSHGATRALLPADAEAPVLLDLALPPLDVLRISHHGSSDPALDALLERASPQLAAISVGAGNSYGHPRPDVVRVLDRDGVPTLRTDRRGSIVFDSDGEHVVARSTR